ERDQNERDGGVERVAEPVVVAGVLDVTAAGGRWCRGKGSGGHGRSGSVVPRSGAGCHGDVCRNPATSRGRKTACRWIPAFAGMTIRQPCAVRMGRNVT